MVEYFLVTIEDEESFKDEALKVENNERIASGDIWGWMFKKQEAGYNFEEKATQKIIHTCSILKSIENFQTVSVELQLKIQWALKC